MARFIAPLRLLNFDDTGAQVAEHHGAEWSGQCACQIQYPQAFEWTTLLFHNTQVSTQGRVYFIYP